MLFNSYEFLFVFLPIILMFYAIAAFNFSIQVRSLVLIAGSLYFYAYVNTADSLLIILSILGNYLLTVLIVKYPLKRYVLVSVGVVANLAVLICYKYLNFFISISNEQFGSNLSIVESHLPLAISFFTFQQISFIVDCYRTQAVTRPRFETYSTAVLFFPHLIAGPLVEYKSLIPQLDRRFKLANWWPKVYIGILVFVLGLSKKIIIADNLTPLVDVVFGNNVDLTKVGFAESFFSCLAYTFQLYFDFSGYSDMAIGLGLMFGIMLPFNFNSPYKATSIVDFWRRWHITLSTFLRNYLYIPLGGSRQGEVKHFRNLFLTMLIGGIWHGAGWQFVAWGAWHGAWLCIVHFLNKKVPMFMNHLFRFRYINQFLTFVCVMLGWIFFRAQNLEQAIDIIRKLFSFRFEYVAKSALSPLIAYKLTLLLLIAAGGIAFLAPNTIVISRFFKWQLYKKKHFVLLILTTVVLALLINLCLLRPETQI